MMAFKAPGVPPHAQTFSESQNDRDFGDKAGTARNDALYSVDKAGSYEKEKMSDGLANRCSTKANRRKKPRGTTSQPGYWAAKHALAKFGSHVIDGRSRVAHALDEFRDEMIADLGGTAAVSTQQRVIVDLAVRTHLMVQSLDNYLLSLGSLVNRRKRCLWPVARERTALADSLAKYMAMLGLQRRPKPSRNLNDYVAEKYGDRNVPGHGQDEHGSANEDRGVEAGAHGTDASTQSGRDI